jgi:hypothetical protein
MRIMKLALAALFAVLAFSAMAASSASAFHPLFLTQSGQELLFSGEGGLSVLRGLNATVLGTIECHKVLIHGWALNKSTLAHRIKLLFHTGCEQTVGSTTTACTEPIHVKELLGELGLLLPGTGLVGIRLEPSDGTKVFVEVTCGSNKTTVEGAILGHIPAVNKNNVNQYNKNLSELELVFESENKNENQKYTEIDLLGVKDTKVELAVAGFFGGKASDEGSGTVKGDGLIEICTLEPQNCP